MAEVIREEPATVVASEPVATERTTVTERPVASRPVVAERPVAARAAVVEPVESRANQIVYLILTIVEVLLAFRLVLRLLGANPNSGFVSFVYAITYPLIYPFIGIFSLPNLETASFELATLIAMVVYAIVAYVIVAIVRISRTRPSA